MLLSLRICCSAQSVSESSAYRRLDFINYLIGLENHKEAIYLLNKELENPELPVYLADTLNHLLAWSHYSLKELKLSAICFENVSASSPSYIKCRFFAAYNKTYLGDTASALKLLNSLDAVTDWQKELLSFQKAGISLLRRDIKSFEKESESFTRQFYALSTEEEHLLDISQKISSHKNKSMVLASIMSAVLPGSGKIYCHKTGEGISSFLIITALGLITWENYRNDGLNNYKTIIFGSAACVYYIGNIWGSAMAAHRQNQKFQYEINQHILFDLHIPLRSIFN